MSTLLFLKLLPLTFMYMSWYMCLSIFLASRYLRSRRLRTRILRIHRILVGSLASLVPLCLSVERDKFNIFTGHKNKKIWKMSYAYTELRKWVNNYCINIPYPEWRPFCLASCALFARDLEWIFWGFLMMKPSLTNFRMFWPAGFVLKHLVIFLSFQMLEYSI